MPERSAISLSVSVVCFHTAAAQLEALFDSLLANLQALAARGDALQVDCYLVDNGASEASPSPLLEDLDEALAGLHGRLQQIGGHGNVGYGAGHNLAIRRSQADYHLILNPDVELAPDCLAAGLDYLQAHPRAVAVSPRASGTAGDRQYLCKRFPSVGLFFLRGFVPSRLQQPFRRALARFEMRELPEDRPSEHIPIISGCFMLCRAQALRAVGGFDESYFLYFEDFDLSLRLRAHGTLVYLPAMRIRHHGGHSARKGVRHIGLFARSGRRFFATHGWQWL